MRRHSRLTWGSGFGLGALFSLAVLYGSFAQTPHPTINAVFPPLPGNQYYNDFNEYVLTSPLVNGINPSLRWASVDKGPGATGGQYQWSNFDSQIQTYINAGKKVNIIVWPVSEGGVNTATPAYVMNSGINVVTCTNYPGNGTKDSGFPVAWQSGFADNYQNFIVEVIQHFTGNPHIGYIRFGLTVGGEIFPFCALQWP
jgi:hypothetical protein